MAAFALVASASSFAAGPNGIVYRGETDQGRDVKLVTDLDGIVKRGAFSVQAKCTGNYKPFAADMAFERPLKRASREGFRERGKRFDTDGTYSGRYRFTIVGERRTKRKIAGEIDLEITFRKDGRRYTTCTAEDLAYKVKVDD